MLEFLDYGLMLLASIGLALAFGPKLPSEIRRTDEEEQ